MTGAVLEDGSEPEPVFQGTGSGGLGRRGTDWWLYDGEWGRPRAAFIRAACTCGWRGEERCRILWEDDGPALDDDLGLRPEWERHMADVRAAAAPVPPDIQDLLEEFGSRLSALADDAPLAGLRAVAAAERIVDVIGFNAAQDVKCGSATWPEIATALGLTEQDAKSRLTRYR